MGRRQSNESITRREALGLATAGMVAACASGVSAQDSDRPAVPADPELEKLIASLKPNYLEANYSAGAKFKPHPAELPADQLRDLGLDQTTWALEVLPGGKPQLAWADKSDPQVHHPLSKSAGTAVTFAMLMNMAQTRAVRFLAGRCCLFDGGPTHVGLWEGVPLRDVIALAKPGDNIRRVFYHGYAPQGQGMGHHSSLSLNRVLEDPPGTLPVILAYKYNGSFLTVRQGGPVRVIVAEDYANRDVKWLLRMYLFDGFKASDSYAGGTAGGNDTGSPLQNRAYFSRAVGGAGGQPTTLVGRIQVGMGGVSKVQYAVCPDGHAPATDDPFLTKLDWQDGVIVPPPTDWGGGFPGGRLPPTPLQFDEAGTPRYWPLRFIDCQWAAVVRGQVPGKYTMYCRTIDLAGNAQPMPRPFRASGPTEINKTTITVTA
jgi:DMSO/TMAO reductase YedYZ molybdopterin-dependent catalytic subunit